MKIIAAIFMFLVLSSGLLAQTAANAGKVETKIGAFFDAYADDLRQKRREAIVDRYDRRGAYFLGHGWKNLSTFEEIKDRYMTKWSGPKAFAWKDLSYEIISDTAVLAVGKFEWQSETDPGPAVCSYTGLILRISGKWRIRVEDESCPPPK